MLVVGLLVSTLAARVRDAAEVARQRERRTQALYALSRELAGPRDAARDRGGRRAPRGRPAALRGRGAAAGRRPRARAGRRRRARPSRATRASWPSRSGSSTTASRRGRTPTRCPAARALYVPLVAGAERLGVLGVELPPALRPLPPDQRELLRGARAPDRRRRSSARGSPTSAERGAARGRERAAAQHAPELGLARPAHAARRHHRRGERAAGRAAAGPRAARASWRRPCSTRPSG